ncbi:MAG: DMT family transporter [Propionicimonas sp.]|uniref:DMT family transporter n=1 Tax=Propionicimonas sp. TaxID=1955623 RepID=UPI002B213E38|nr:DMT family transporter [Propionicimonas sp.]MEA4945450.1 DMT family transporter [Propionicimonas sp.]MEA5116509.1 DMT family transporter [Propionicimonas sp.]
MPRQRPGGPAGRATAGYLLSLLLYGSSGVVATAIALPSHHIAFLRILIASLLLVGLFVASGQRPGFLKRRRSCAFLAASGASMGLGSIFLLEAYQQVGVGVATLLFYLGPVLMMALSPVLFRERLTWAKLAGFAVVLAGFCLLNGRALVQGGSEWGLICGGLAAVGLAGQVIFNKLAVGIEGLANATGQLLAGLLTVTVVVGFRTGFTIPVVNSQWIPILVLGLVNTGVGSALYYSSLGRLPIQTVALVGYLEPLAAVLLAVWVLGEPMTALQLLGGGLILGGAAFGTAVGPRPAMTAAAAATSGTGVGTLVLAKPGEHRDRVEGPEWNRE